MTLSDAMFSAINGELKKGRDVLLPTVVEEELDNLGRLFSSRRIDVTATIEPLGRDGCVASKEYSVKIYAREARPEGGHHT
jgi:hypothetical protein